MQNKKGFTLLELLVVVLIIGILAAIALPQYYKAVDRSRTASLISMLNTVQKSLDLIHLNYNLPNHTCFTGNSGEGNRNMLDIDILEGWDCSTSGTYCRKDKMAMEITVNYAVIDYYMGSNQVSLELSSDVSSGTWEKRCQRVGSYSGYERIDAICQYLESDGWINVITTYSGGYNPYGGGYGGYY